MLEQSFRDLEVVVIDDGSDDGTLDDLEKIRDRRLILRQNQDNLGQARTLNDSMAASSSEFIARMDADDISLPRRIERQVSFLSERSDIGIVGSWVRRFGANSHGTWRTPATHDDIAARLLFQSVMAHPTVMIRRNIADQLQYRLDVAPVEDWDLWQKASFMTRLANIPEVHLLYRVKTAAERGLGASTYETNPVRIQRLCEVAAPFLRALELDPGPDDVDLHISLGRHTLRPDAVEIDRAERWLLRVLEANVRMQRYELVAFKRAVGDIWWHVGYAFADRGPWSLGRILKSPLLSTLQHVGVSNWSRLFVRIAQRSGVPSKE